ncbi:MAG: trans-acting enoyl reductase family protein [Kofleriaceae bacterium]
MTRDFELVVFGATGFTGKLVADYIARSADQPRWAIAGRSRAKLEALGHDVPVLVGDALDPAQMAAIATRSKVVCSAAGPYAKYGSELVAACVAAGTHYCDLTGEVPWMRRMIDAHHARAGETGARIVHTCGFDSIPSDLGTWALQQAMTAKLGAPATSVTGLFGSMSGGISGGTAASAFGISEEKERDPAIRALLQNPYALDPDPHAPRPPVDKDTFGWDRRVNSFTAPFVMARVNTRIVRRSHALAGLPWGHDFVYREMVATPATPAGLGLAVGLSMGLTGLKIASRYRPLRSLLAKVAPKPGSGPSAERRLHGHWELQLIGELGDQRMTYHVGDPNGDPGYASTAKMLGESALCLARDKLSSPGGVLTPSIAMGPRLIARLRRIGFQFEPGGASRSPMS